MPKTILMMYVTLLPVIVSGVANMAWCRSDILKAAKRPLDNGKCFFDGKRIFGDNKTWKGVIGYVVFNAVFCVIWGMICKAASMESLDFFYVNRENTAAYNVMIGMLLGLAYSVFELPNSFMKRRLGITPGKTVNGFYKAFFVFLDQADSIFGCALVVWMFYDLGIWIYLLYVLIGAVTHIVFNMLLYLAKKQKNMF